MKYEVHFVYHTPQARSQWIEKYDDIEFARKAAKRALQCRAATMVQVCSDSEQRILTQKDVSMMTEKTILENRQEIPGLKIIIDLEGVYKLEIRDDDGNVILIENAAEALALAEMLTRAAERLQ